MSPVRYELGFYIPKDDILHSHRRENLKSYTLSMCPLQTRFLPQNIQTGGLKFSYRLLHCDFHNPVSPWKLCRMKCISSSYVCNIMYCQLPSGMQHTEVSTDTSGSETQSLLCVLHNKNFEALSPQANYTDWATATCRRNLVLTFADRGVSRGQRGGSPTAVNLSFLDRSRYFFFK
jgi:hypothetical protein